MVFESGVSNVEDKDKGVEKAKSESHSKSDNDNVEDKGKGVKR